MSGMDVPPVWGPGWRRDIWQQLDRPWDLVIVGGGITGAGILREATRRGLRALLVEQRDFSWGTSSRSSKMVHGGLRYLREGRLGLTIASVHERQQLLAEGPGLIDPLGFLLAAYDRDSVGRLVYRAGLTVYDLLALRWSHRYYDSQDFRMLAPHLTEEGLKGGFRYGDAQTDDARLVLRVIRESVADGGVALNYARAEALLRDESGRVEGVQLRDLVSDQTAAARGRVVINATGAWADGLREQVGGRARIRPLRGSHLVFPSWRLPMAQAVSFMHPWDLRPVMCMPWEGATLVGTTDVDHAAPLSQEPAISGDEVAYLMAAVDVQFPSLAITLEDVVATFAGVRPVIDTGQADPSKESRDHEVWYEDGLLTVTGGKLTTFRVIARDTLEQVEHLLPDLPPVDPDAPVLEPVLDTLDGAHEIEEDVRRRLLGRYGADAARLVAAAAAGELLPVAGSTTLWAELRWAARAEGVVHLEDLLLRRLRLGILLPQGAAAQLPRIRAICQPELGWDDQRWQSEEVAYRALIASQYSLPPAADIPQWRSQASPPAARPAGGGRLLAGVAGLAGLAVSWWMARRRRWRQRGPADS